MSLLCFPDGILEDIAASLDFESLIAFARADRRLWGIALKFVDHVRLREPLKFVKTPWGEIGESVRSLDVSNCEHLPLSVAHIIMNCYNITKLDVVNTRIWDEDLISLCNWLPRLESLSVSLTTLHSTRSISLKASRPVKKLYVEARPDSISLRVVIDLMNMLDNLEVAHVNLIGAVKFPPYEHLPILKASRWKKLHTFVCSTHLSKDRFMHTPLFLKRIFAFNYSREIKYWIERPKNCYIYEHGYFNLHWMNASVTDDRLKFLNHYQAFDLTGRSVGETIKSPWKSPKSLRLKGLSDFREFSDHPGLCGLFTATLMELDLTECHGRFSRDFWQHLVASSPCLEALALPLCLFLNSAENRDGGETLGPQSGTSASRAMNLQDALQNLRLKKLFVRGNPEPSPVNSWAVADCPSCWRVLAFENFPELGNLQRLEELTINNATVDPSAFRGMANRGIRTLRLHLNSIIEFSGMRDFIEACENLQNLKFSGFDSPLHTVELWKIIAAGKYLERVCLGTRSTSSVKVWDMQQILLQIPRRIEQIHFHVKEFDDTDAFRSNMEQCLKKTGRQMPTFETKFFCEDKLTSQYGLKGADLSEPFLGRSLCHLESFIGFVKPEQWDLNEY